MPDRIAEGAFEPRVAVLVDGENVSHRQSGAILSHASRLGSLSVRRVYGDVAKLCGWDALAGFRLIHSGQGKNAADLLLAIDAMELAHGGGIDRFVIASSDGDFAHLAERLSARGHSVLGLGEAKAPERFRAACSKFQQLDTPISGLDLKVHDLIQGAGGSMKLKELAERARQVHGIAIGASGNRTWRAYLQSRPMLFLCDPRGPEACVRLKRS